MKNIELQNWIVKENTFEIALLNSYYAILQPGNYSIEVEIIDSNSVIKKYKFQNFENAFSFVEKHVSKALSYNDIDEAYNNLNKDKAKVRTKTI